MGYDGEDCEGCYSGDEWDDSDDYQDEPEDYGSDFLDEDPTPEGLGMGEVFFEDADSAYP